MRAHVDGHGGRHSVLASWRENSFGVGVCALGLKPAGSLCDQFVNFQQQCRLVQSMGGFQRLSHQLCDWFLRVSCCKRDPRMPLCGHSGLLVARRVLRRLECNLVGKVRLRPSWRLGVGSLLSAAEAPCCRVLRCRGEVWVSTVVAGSSCVGPAAQCHVSCQVCSLLLRANCSPGSLLLGRYVPHQPIQVFSLRAAGARCRLRTAFRRP